MPFTLFEELSAAIRSLGIDVTAQANKLLAALRVDGLELESQGEIFRSQSGLYRLLPDGRIVKVILYIAQKTLYNNDEITVDAFHRFHLFDCETLQQMRAIGREHKYRMATRTDGRFRYLVLRHNKVVREYSGEAATPLRFCGNCRRHYDRLYNRNGRRPFRLADFVESVDIIGTAAGTCRYDCDLVPDQYADAWPQIAEQAKERAGFSCQQCHAVLADRPLRRFLHAHHIDGDKRNMSAANIRVLCIKCHAEQPLHSHVKRTPEYRTYSEKMQGSRGTEQHPA